MVKELDDKSGVYISELPVGDSAERDGNLCVGDILVSVDENTVRGRGFTGCMDVLKGNTGDYIHLTFQRKVEEEIVVTGSSNGNDNEVEVTISKPRPSARESDLGNTSDYHKPKKSGLFGPLKKLAKKVIITNKLQYDEVQVEVEIAKPLVIMFGENESKTGIHIKELPFTGHAARNRNLKEGDFLSLVNGIDVSNKNFDDTIRVLKTQNGHTIKMEFNRRIAIVNAEVERVSEPTVLLDFSARATNAANEDKPGTTTPTTEAKLETRKNGKGFGGFFRQLKSDAKTENQVFVDVTVSMPTDQSLGIAFSEAPVSGLIITGMPETGFAAKAGELKLQDLLFTVNGKDVSGKTFDEGMDALKACKGDFREMTFKRKVLQEVKVGVKEVTHPPTPPEAEDTGKEVWVNPAPRVCGSFNDEEGC